MKLYSALAATTAALALLTAAGAASAQTTVSVNAAVTTDYVFRGISQTDEDPAFQLGLDLTTAEGFYLGVWGSNVDFGDSTDAEIDLYGGYRTEKFGYALDAGVIGYLYTDAPKILGNEYNYTEFKLAASRAIGPATIGAAVYYSPDFFGADDEATYVELNGSFSPISNFTVSGAVGEQYLDVSDDYATWNLGATYTIPGSPIAVDVRYTDTDIKGLGIAEDRFIGTLKATF